MAYMTMIYASNKNTQGVGYGYGGLRDSVDVGIPTGFSVGMGWVWALKFNPHGSPVSMPTTVMSTWLCRSTLRRQPSPDSPACCPVDVGDWMTVSRLRLNPAKTQVLVVAGLQVADRAGRHSTSTSVIVSTQRG